MRVERIANVGQLRPSVRVDQELDWFFNRAECDMGDQSNYLGILASHGVESALPSPDDAAEAAHRARRIRDALLAMDSSDAGVLQCAYELRDWPVALWDVLGRVTGVVVRLACALDRIPEDRDALRIIETARAAWLARMSPHASIDRTFLRLKRDGEARFARAHHEYTRVTRRSA